MRNLAASSSRRFILTPSVIAQRSNFTEGAVSSQQKAADSGDARKAGHTDVFEGSPRTGSRDGLERFGSAGELPLSLEGILSNTPQMVMKPLRALEGGGRVAAPSGHSPGGSIDLCFSPRNLGTSNNKGSWSASPEAKGCLHCARLGDQVGRLAEGLGDVKAHLMRVEVAVARARERETRIFREGSAESSGTGDVEIRDAMQA